jgi:hypothetical protein
MVLFSLITAKKIHHELSKPQDPRASLAMVLELDEVYKISEKLKIVGGDLVKASYIGAVFCSSSTIWFLPKGRHIDGLEDKGQVNEYSPLALVSRYYRIASIKEQMDTIEALMKRGADVNGVGLVGITPLQNYIETIVPNLVSMVERVLLWDADPDSMVSSGLTPVQLVISNIHDSRSKIKNPMDIITLLIQAGASTKIISGGEDVLEKGIQRTGVELRDGLYTRVKACGEEPVRSRIHHAKNKEAEIRKIASQIGIEKYLVVPLSSLCISILKSVHSTPEECEAFVRKRMETVGDLCDGYDGSYDQDEYYRPFYVEKSAAGKVTYCFLKSDIPMIASTGINPRTGKKISQKYIDKIKGAPKVRHPLTPCEMTELLNKRGTVNRDVSDQYISLLSKYYATSNLDIMGDLDVAELRGSPSYIFMSIARLLGLLGEQSESDYPITNENLYNLLSTEGYGTMMTSYGSLHKLSRDRVDLNLSSIVSKKLFLELRVDPTKVFDILKAAITIAPVYAKIWTIYGKEGVLSGKGEEIPKDLMTYDYMFRAGLTFVALEEIEYERINEQMKRDWEAKEALREDARRRVAMEEKRMSRPYKSNLLRRPNEERGGVRDESRTELDRSVGLLEGGDITPWNKLWYLHFFDRLNKTSDPDKNVWKNLLGGKAVMYTNILPPELTMDLHTYYTEHTASGTTVIQEGYVYDRITKTLVPGEGLTGALHIAAYMGTIIAIKDIQKEMGVFNHAVLVEGVVNIRDYTPDSYIGPIAILSSNPTLVRYVDSDKESELRLSLNSITILKPVSGSSQLLELNPVGEDSLTLLLFYHPRRGDNKYTVENMRELKDSIIPMDDIVLNITKNKHELFLERTKSSRPSSVLEELSYDSEHREESNSEGSHRDEESFGEEPSGEGEVVDEKFSNVNFKDLFEASD